MAVPQVEQVAGQGSPQVDAGDPGQHGVLEAGSDVRVVCVHGQIGVLGTKRRIQGQPCAALGSRSREGAGPESCSMRSGGQKACEYESLSVQTSRHRPECELFQEAKGAPFPHIFSVSLTDV